MKTMSIVYARCGIALLAFFAAVPGFAQGEFASQRSYSFNGQDKLLAASYLTYFTPTDLMPDGRRIATVAFSSSSFNNIKGGDNYIDKPGVTTDSRFDKNDNISNVSAGEIRFKRTSFTYPANSGKDIGIAEYSSEQLMLYAVKLKEYAKKNGFDTSYAFFSNMGMLTNKKRFFVVNLVTMKIEQTGLVTQGRGQGPSRFDKHYSNNKGSKCTSLGRYKIIKKYKGEYGEAYKMTGLDSSNCNALKRNIVLHSMGCMPDAEENMPVCISEGCPAVSVKFLSSLSKIIDSRKKPMLLWIFDSNLEEVIVEQKRVNYPTQADCAEGKTCQTCPVHQPRKMASLGL
jgi:hypothetical protein